MPPLSIDISIRLGSMVLVGSGGPPAWSPTDYTNLLAWWDFSDTATITHTTNQVDSVTDKSGNGNTLSETGGNRPETNTRTINGLNCLDFHDGGGEHLEAAAMAMPTSGDFLISFAAEFDGTAASNTNASIMSMDAANDWQFTTKSTTGEFVGELVQAGMLSSDVTSTFQSLWGRHIVQLEFNWTAGFFYLYVNGVLSGAADYTTGKISASVLFRMCSNRGGTQSVGAGFGECFISEDVGATARQDAIDYLNPKWNVYWDGSLLGTMDNYTTNLEVFASHEALLSSYTGATCRLYREADAKEIDHYAYHDGRMNASQITSFASSGRTKIADYYDQSGNGYIAAQATLANMERITNITGTLDVNPAGHASPLGVGTETYVLNNPAIAQPWSQIGAGYFTSFSSFRYYNRGANSWFDFKTGDLDLFAGANLQSGLTTLVAPRNLFFAGVGNSTSSKIVYEPDTETVTVGDAGSNGLAANDTLRGRSTGTQGLPGYGWFDAWYSSDNEADWVGMQSKIKARFE